MPSNTYGRQVVLILTNKSGGSVAAGDVVVFDTTTDESFTTTTTGRAELSVGIAQETIASNAVGRVLVSGYAALVNVPASVTRGHYIETHTVVKQATGSATRRSGSFGQFAKTSATPSAWLWGQTDQTVTSSGISAGTANPGTPADGDLFNRTDLGLIIRYHSTGTRWMCVCPHQVDIGMQDALTPISANGSLRASGPYPIANSILILGSALSIYVNTTNDASNYWSLAFPNATLTTAAVAAGAWRRLTSATTSVVDLTSAAAAVFDCPFTKTGAPGSAYPAANMIYKYIVT